jgi:hypothetical protein
VSGEAAVPERHPLIRRRLLEDGPSDRVAASHRPRRRDRPWTSDARRVRGRGRRGILGRCLASVGRSPLRSFWVWPSQHAASRLAVSPGPVMPVRRTSRRRPLAGRPRAVARARAEVRAEQAPAAWTRDRAAARTRDRATARTQVRAAEGTQVPALRVSSGARERASRRAARPVNGVIPGPARRAHAAAGRAAGRPRRLRAAHPVAPG